MATIPNFTTFTFPVIRKPSKDRPPKPHDHHRFSPILTKLRCPGCCGPVVARFFEGYEYGDVKKGDYYAYTCGSLHLKRKGNNRWVDQKIGPHGSLAYIEFTDQRRLQDALDEEFEKLQASREEELEKFEESGDPYVEVRGCFPGVTRRYIPKGRLKATQHGIDCACTHHLQE